MFTCIAVDDEPLALELLQKHIAKIFFLDFKGAFTDPFEAKKILDETNIDILFLDIQMPDINGIEFSKIINKKNTAVIFTTAFSEYAVEGFNVDAIDYLLKPIEYDRFLKSVYKAKEYIDFINNQELQDGYIFVKSDYQMTKINLKEILYIEGLDDYIKIYLPQKSVLTLMTLKTISQKLPSKEFIRIHRSYIVPVSKIGNISKSKVKIGEKEIPIGISYSESFFSVMDKKMN
ncbi:MAG: response regulator transcription factor [Bacteroidetes bacterium]|nr:response regulator transcription factor [Bacteroidota bacterium]MBS1974130.1 response regulator transcription factor [Bacteroidota bacterium]